MGHWIVTSQAGTVTAPPAPDAPNILAGTTVAPRYVAYGHDWLTVFDITAALPTTDTNYSHLKRIEVTCDELSDLVADPQYAPFGGTSITFTTKAYPRVAGTYHIAFNCINDDGVRTASPLVKTVTVTEPSITSISTPREIPGTLAVDPVTRLRSTRVGGIPVFAGNQVPQVCSYFFSWDNGATYLQIGAEQITAVGTEIAFAVLSPETAKTCKLAMCASYVLGDASTYISAANLPAGTVVSAGFTVAGLTAPGATLGTTLTVAAGAGGTFPYAARTPDGRQYWSIPSITLDIASLASVVDAFFARITAQDYDAAGHAIGPEKEYGGDDVTKASWSNDLIGEYGTAGDGFSRAYPYPAGTPTNICKVRLRVYVCSRKNQATGAFADPTTSTLQTDIGGGAGYVDVTVAVGGAIPDGAIPANRMDPATLSGLYVDSASGVLLAGTSDNPANLLTNPAFERGALGWLFDPSNYIVTPAWALTPPNTLRMTGATTYARQALKLSVVPGQAYNLQVSWRSESSANGGIDADLDYYDTAGAYVSSDTVSATGASIAGAWHTALLDCTVPAGAVKAQFRLHVSSNTTGEYYVDNCLLIPQASTGDGMQPDGRGGAKVKPGPGVGVDGSGRVIVKTGATTDTDGSGNVVVKSGTLGDAYFVGGGLGGDLSKWASGRIPFGYYYGLPSPYDTNIPAVIINTAETPWRVYNRVSSAWVAQKVQPGDLVAGTITALVGLNSPTISGGTISAPAISGGSLTIASGAVTLTISPSANGGFPGIKIVDTGSGKTLYGGGNGWSVFNNANSGIYTVVSDGLIIMSDGTHFKAITAYP